MPLGNAGHLLRLWEWALGKRYRILIAIPSTLVAFAVLYLFFFVETEDRLQVLANWCSDMAFWIGIPVEWMTAYWHVFLAVALAIITVSCILVYIVFKVNQEMMRRVENVKDDLAAEQKRANKLEEAFSHLRLAYQKKAGLSFVESESAIVWSGPGEPQTWKPEDLYSNAVRLADEARVT
ncbi:MAG: hypothetical protein WCW68_10625 [Methanothrix sp.]